MQLRRSLRFGAPTTVHVDTLDDDLMLQILRLVTRARDSKSAALVCKHWRTLSCEVWKMRANLCVAPQGLAWRPALAVEVEAYMKTDCEANRDDVKAHVARVQALPFVMGLTPAPVAAMWAKTKPTLTGGQQVYLNDDGEERNDGTWGCNECVSDFGCDSNWNRGFVWGVMSFAPDCDKEVAYYTVLICHSEHSFFEFFKLKKYHAAQK